jgi:hypothetical protein
VKTKFQFFKNWFGVFLTNSSGHPVRVARWFVFKPKLPTLVNFGGSWNRKSWYILWPFGLFFGHLVYFVVIWYISPRFGMLYHEKSGNPARNPIFPRVELFNMCQLTSGSAPTKSCHVTVTLQFVGGEQGDQVGRIFAKWAIVLSGQFF